MTRRNPDRYTAQDWREAGPTVGAIIADRRRVYIECDLGALRAIIPAKAGRADLNRIARERGQGSSCGGGARPAAGWSARGG